MTVAPLTLSFLLFAFITKLPLAFSDNVEPVIDTARNPIVPGNEYFLAPVVGSQGGGLILGKTGNSTCPVTILHDPLAVMTGARFNIPGTSSEIIYTGSPIDIEVAVKSNCVESSKSIVYYDYDIHMTCVGIGGPEDHPGKEILNGTFNTQKSGEYFNKFVFCISDCPICLHIGKYDNGERVGRLVLTPQDKHLFASFMVLLGIRSIV